MAASHHQPQQNPTRQVDGLTDRKSSFGWWQDAVAMQTQRLLQQQPDSSSTVHAVTTPTIKTLLQVRAKTYMGWITKAHGAGLGACTL
jgi:hypothetical protein